MQNHLLIDNCEVYCSKNSGRPLGMKLNQQMSVVDTGLSEGGNFVVPADSSFLGTGTTSAAHTYQGASLMHAASQHKPPTL